MSLWYFSFYYSRLVFFSSSNSLSWRVYNQEDKSLKIWFSLIFASETHNSYDLQAFDPKKTPGYTALIQSSLTIYEAQFCIEQIASD